jgi:hypothetical protein
MSWSATLDGVQFTAQQFEADYGFRQPVTVGGSTYPRFIGMFVAWGREADQRLIAAQAALDLRVATTATTLTGTSTSTLTISAGAKTLTTQPTKAFAAGAVVTLYRQADPTVWLLGTIASYDAATGALGINVNDVAGSGTASDWAIAVSGIRGPVGPVGPIGPQGIQGLPGTGASIHVAQYGVTATAQTRPVLDLRGLTADDDAVGNRVRIGLGAGWIGPLSQGVI